MKHTTTYYLCKKLIDAGKLDIVRQKVPVFFAADSITEEEYREISEMLREQ